TSLALRAWSDGDSVVVEVEDDGTGFELAITTDGQPDPQADEGRGLFVVASLADQLDVFRRGHRTVVEAVKRAVLPRGRARGRSDGVFGRPELQLQVPHLEECGRCPPAGAAEATVETCFSVGDR